MSIVGVGVDIINVQKIDGAVKRHGVKFTKKILTSEEISQLGQRGNKIQFIASRFSAKEAIYKATTNLAKLKWKDISILNKMDGSPYIKI
ncbi:MAG: holo-ACP synthase, partial [Planctomycetes bacterium]|nr:holo-ACP synthase [Planctomycetota bacterium]